MKILFEIFYNLGAPVAFSIFSGLFGMKEEKKILAGIFHGFMFGIASVIGIFHPFVLSSGLIFDGRTVMVSLATIFFGPIAGTLAGVFSIIARLSQGGLGTLTGISHILFAYFMGLYFYIKLKNKNQAINTLELLKLGLITHLGTIVLFYTLPVETANYIIREIGLAFIITYTIATILLGKILSQLLERNKILDELHIQYKLLEKREYDFRNIFENSADAIIIMINNKIVDCNQATLNLFSVKEKDQIINKEILDFSPYKQEDGKLSSEKFEILIAECEKNNKSRFVWSHVDKDGKILPTEIVLTSIELRGEKVFHALIRDISMRKEFEKKLEKLSYHDHLTGLYNRRFFKEELDRLNIRRNLPITVIMGDVNGLKLVNDSFGHNMGDKLLVKVADLMKLVCRADDIISRIGGDEFVILLPKTESNEAENIVNRIYKIALEDKVGSLDVSISFGWATKKNEYENIDDILKKAEDNLYKKKLFESPKTRGKTIETIINTLHEKNLIEKEHSKNVSLLCEKMGIELGFLQEDVNELKKAGFLHDIGKIAIEESMLNKPRKLTENERIEIKRHPEIGYRILSTVNEMSEMSEYVLSHHERWDGEGYPKGLKGEEIPLQGRIISIANVYDTIISERPYREKLTKKNAIEELMKNSGTQFDPELIKVFLKVI